MFGEISSDTYSSSVTVNNSGTGTVYIAHNGGANSITGDLTISATGNAGNVYVATQSGASLTIGGNCTISNTSIDNTTLYVGDNGDLTVNGDLTINNNGAGTNSLVYLADGATSTCIIDGSTTINSAGGTSNSRIYLGNNGDVTFNGITSLTKIGTSNEITYGGCTYNNVTFAISGTGYLGLANNEANDYNGDVTLVQNSTGYFRPDYNRDCTISGDLNLNLTTVTRFGDAAGSIIFDGNGNQAINDLGPAVEHIFEEMVVNKSGGELTINTPITVANSITLTQGIVNTTETNVISVVDNAVASGASDASYVDGPIIKLGNDAFTFPVGDGGNYQPIGISAPNSGSASFRAQYFMANPSNSFDINFNDANLDHVSSREFWILDRLATTASADVILSFDANSGDVDNLTDLRVARWDGSEWVSEGNGGTTGTTAAGTLQSTTRVSSFSPFTFGSSTANNPLPVDLADFNGKCENENVEFSWTTLSELNNDYFEILASENGADFYSLSSINGKGTTNETNHYHQKLKIDFLKNDFLLFQLKQVDFDGKESFSNIKKIENCETQNFDFDIYPNPVTEGFTYLPTSINQNTYYKVVSISGAILQEGLIPENNKLIFEKIAAGVYFLQLETNNTVYKKRFVIQ